MDQAFRITELEQEPRGQRVHFELRGPRGAHPVFFRCSEPVLEAGLESLLACGLLPAMREGARLDLAGEASARLLSGLPTIVDILTAWVPELAPVSFPRLVPVAQERASRGRVGSFFSGGVDSFYTFLKHRDEITDLVFIHGFDVPLEDEDLLRRVAASVDEVGAEFGVGVVHVETNLKPVIKTYVGWGLPGHGPALAAVGHLLAPAFERIYVPSSFHYADLDPWGTHPLLDPLWSSEVLEFVHDGAGSRRVEKVGFISDFAAALRGVRVCNAGQAPLYNCGRCEKCVRTMISLEVAGKLAQCPAFAAPLDAASILQLPRKEGGPARRLLRAFFGENLEALRKRGIRPDLQRAIERRLRGPTWLDGLRRRGRRIRRRLLKRRTP